MSQFINEVHLVGRVGQDPVIKQFGSRRCARLSIATNRSYKGKDGNWVEEPTWHSVTAWENNNRVFIDKIFKGEMVEVRGYLKMNRYTSKSGEERSFMEVIATELHHADEPDQRKRQTARPTPPPLTEDDMPADDNYPF